MKRMMTKKSLATLMLFIMIFIAIATISMGILIKENDIAVDVVADTANPTISKQVNANVGIHYRWTDAATSYNGNANVLHVQRDTNGLPTYEKGEQASLSFELDGTDPVKAYQKWIEITNYAIGESTDPSQQEFKGVTKTYPTSKLTVKGSYAANKYVYVKLTGDWKANYWTNATTTTTNASSSIKFKAGTLTDDMATADVAVRSFYYDVNARYLKNSVGDDVLN